MLMAMREGRQNRELVFNQLGQVLTPTWSPDGKSIAFSALAGGFTDLYLFDLSTNTLRQLTDDPSADLQPSWSHDGHTIAFVTERYSSDLAVADVRASAAGAVRSRDRHGPSCAMSATSVRN